MGRPELEEDVDLDPELQRYVLDVHDRLEHITHYELLGVPRTADKKAIKSAYFRLAATVHPDRHFKKRLGSFKDKLVKIFGRIDEAYRVLTTDARAAYDATLGAGPSPVPKADAVVTDPILAAKRRAALDALKKQFEDGKAKALDLAERGRRAHAAGDLATAEALLKQALVFAPKDAALAAAHADVARQAGAKLAESYARKAALEERFGRWESAVESWQKALAAKPDDAEARARLGAALARARRQT